MIGRDSERPAGEPPVIHHAAESTTVVGVARTATALHKTLKDHGFRWSARTTSWVLPSDMDPQARTDRVNELLTSLRTHKPRTHCPTPRRARPDRRQDAGRRHRERRRGADADHRRPLRPRTLTRPPHPIM